MTTEVNLNNYVHVKLTPHGKEVYMKSGAKFPTLDEDDFLKIQLWELMQIFGKEMYNGNPKNSFVNNEIVIGK